MTRPRASRPSCSRGTGARRTLACLRSLAEVTYRPFSVVVVDNGSGDGSADAVAAEHPDVQLVRLTENLGLRGRDERRQPGRVCRGRRGRRPAQQRHGGRAGLRRPAGGGLAADPAAAAPALRSCSPASRRGSGTRVHRSSPGVATAAVTSGYGQAAATRDSGAVSDRSGLRRGDAGHGGGRGARRPVRRGAVRLRRGHRLVAACASGAGCTPIVVPAEHRPPCRVGLVGRRVVPGDDLLRAAQLARRRRALGTARARWDVACGASRLLPPPRLRRCLAAPGGGLRAVRDAWRDFPSRPARDRVKRRPRASRSSAATPACGCSCTCVHRGIAWVTVMAAARSAGPRPGSCATRGFCPVSWRASRRPDSRIARVSSAPRAARAGACACSRTSCSSTTPTRRARWRASSRRSASACSTSPSSTRSAGCTRCWPRCHA